MKAVKLFLVVLLFFVPLVLSGQIDSVHTVGGWKITKTSGSVQKAHSRVVVDTFYAGSHSQSYFVETQNENDGSSVTFEKKYSQTTKKSSGTQGVMYIYVKKLGPSFPNSNYVSAIMYFGNDSGYTSPLAALFIPGFVYTAWYPITFPITNAPDSFNKVKIVIELHGTKDVEVFFDALALNRGGADPDIIIDNFEDTMVPVEKEPTLPNSFKLFQNYPNPFNPGTVISYQLSVTSNVKITVYDILGREVAILVNEEKFPGNYEVKFNASNLPSAQGGLASGTYFYRLSVGNYTETKKMLLVK